MIQKINFGEIWLADLNPQNGTEPGKYRPVLIIQDQVLLDISHPSTLIVPLTTNLVEDSEPLRIRIKAHNQLEKDSDLLIDQIRAIDNRRFRQGPFTKCDNILMKKVHKAILEVISCKIESFQDE